MYELLCDYVKPKYDEKTKQKFKVKSMFLLNKLIRFLKVQIMIIGCNQLIR